jgi:ATP-binding cassette subfamily G (WHITE) protein 2 (SNQ2)
MYSWVAFVTGLIVAELPYLVICAVLYFFCFYYTAGLPTESSKAGPIFLIMLLYEFIYTGIGQFIAAYAHNAVAASLVNPLVIFTLVGFCGAIVPYSQMVDFWKYWLYYLNVRPPPSLHRTAHLTYPQPFQYLMGSLLVFSTHDIQVQCRPSEFAIFDPLPGQTCAQYLSNYLSGMGSGTNLTNPDATAGCRVCQYRSGQDYLRTLNLPEYYYGWRDVGIVAIFVLSSYGCVYALMKLRTKKTKTAE